MGWEAHPDDVRDRGDDGRHRLASEDGGDQVTRTAKEWFHPPTILLGVLVGLLLVPLSGYWWDWVQSEYDRRFPVVEGKLRLVGSDAERILITFQLTKNRDCQYLRMIAYTTDDWGTRTDARIRRIDGEEVDYSRPRGNYSLGTWEVAPRHQATGLHVEALHECGGRIVKSNLGDLRL